MKAIIINVISNEPRTSITVLIDDHHQYYRCICLIPWRETKTLIRQQNNTVDLPLIFYSVIKTNQMYSSKAESARNKKIYVF